MCWFWCVAAQCLVLWGVCLHIISFFTAFKMDNVVLICEQLHCEHTTLVFQLTLVLPAAKTKLLWNSAPSSFDFTPWYSQDDKATPRHRQKDGRRCPSATRCRSFALPRVSGELSLQRTKSTKGRVALSLRITVSERIYACDVLLPRGIRVTVSAIQWFTCIRVTTQTHAWRTPTCHRSNVNVALLPFKGFAASPCLDMGLGINGSASLAGSLKYFWVKRLHL